MSIDSGSFFNYAVLASSQYSGTASNDSTFTSFYEISNKYSTDSVQLSNIAGQKDMIQVHDDLSKLSQDAMELDLSTISDQKIYDFQVRVDTIYQKLGSDAFDQSSEFVTSTKGRLSSISQELSSMGSSAATSTSASDADIKSELDGFKSSISESISDSETSLVGLFNSSGNDAVAISNALADITQHDLGIDQTFSGDNGDYATVTHNNNFLQDEGTIDLTFSASNLEKGKVYGLFSKDLKGKDGGLTMFIKNKKLTVHFEGNDGRVHKVRMETKLEKDEEYNVSFTFGDSGMRLYVNGEVQDSDGYSGGLNESDSGNQNTHDIGIGTNLESANLAGSGLTREKGFFRGEIKDVAILEKAISSNLIEARYTGDASKLSGYVAVSNSSGNGTQLDEIQGGLKRLDNRLATTDSSTDMEALGIESYNRLQNISNMVKEVSEDDPFYSEIQAIGTTIDAQIADLSQKLDLGMKSDPGKLASVKKFGESLSNIAGRFDKAIRRNDLGSQKGRGIARKEKLPSFERFEKYVQKKTQEKEGAAMRVGSDAASAMRKNLQLNQPANKVFQGYLKNLGEQASLASKRSAENFQSNAGRVEELS